MDINTANRIRKWCFPVNVSLIDRLNILYYDVTNTLVLWNKYQIIIYNDYDTNKNPAVIVPEFILSKILIVSNCLICLDENGNLHYELLKYKKSIQNQVINFKPRDQAIIALINLDDYVVCLQKREKDLLLVQYQIKTGLKKINQCILNTKTHILWKMCYKSSKETILRFKMLTDIEKNILKKPFHVILSKNEELLLLVLSFDHRSVYGCICNKRDMSGNIDVHFLYYCASELVDIEIYSHENSTIIIIGLKSGTFVILNLSDDDFKPKVVHVNTSICRFVYHKNCVVYSNGCTMWRVENILSDVTDFRQFFITQIKDFLMSGDRIICITFSNIVYTFSFDDENSYIVNPKQFHPVNGDDLLISAETLFNDIQTEVKSNEEILEKLKREENLTAAMALANKQDLMQKAILYKVLVYEKYPDVMDECGDVLLINDLKDYFEANTFSILIHLALASEYTQKIKEILSSLIDELRLHLTIANECTKTISVKFDEIKNQTSFLIAYHKNDFELNLKMKLVSSMKGVFNESETIWTVISRKNVILRSEHFIDSTKKEFNPRQLKKFEKDVHFAIIDEAEKYFGALYSFEQKSETGIYKEFTFYIQLPENFENILSNISSYGNTFNKSKAEYLLKELGSSDFLKKSKCVVFHLQEVKVKISVVDEFSKKHLQISSTNLVILFHFRCYFSKLLYNGSDDQNFLLSQVEYTVLENLKRKLHTSLSSPVDEDAIMDTTEKFHKNVLGSLPL